MVGSACVGKSGAGVGAEDTVGALLKVGSMEELGMFVGNTGDLVGLSVTMTGDSVGISVATAGSVGLVLGCSDGEPVL